MTRVLLSVGTLVVLGTGLSLPARPQNSPIPAGGPSAVGPAAVTAVRRPLGDVHPAPGTASDRAVGSESGPVIHAAGSVHWTDLSPNQRSNVCTDTLLRIRFSSSDVRLGAGTLRIYDAGGGLVDTIDLGLNASNGAQIRTIGGADYYAHPVILRGNEATVYPHPGVLRTQTTYYVLMDTGFFRDAAGADVEGVTDPAVWRFTTKAVLPDPEEVTNVIVAADGTGDFATVQGAIDWIPADSDRSYTVHIRRGVYEEILRVPAGKNRITFVGEGWRETVLTYANNNNFQLEIAGTATRCMFYAGGDDLVFKNLTFTNSTPQGGSQAEAVRVQGSRILFDNCNFCSYQDTILVNSPYVSAGFFNKCFVQGDVDFIWGSGMAYFNRCEIRAMRRAGNAPGIYTQARTPQDTYGLVFVDCVLTASAPGMSNWTLGRDGGNAHPYGNVAWIRCRMDAHISPLGWSDGGLVDKSTLRFWEYRSTDLTGTNLIPTNRRVRWSRQISDELAARLQDPAGVFAPVGWIPALGAYVAGPPTNQTVYAGQTVVLAAAVGGVPEPVCQWYRDDQPVPGANQTVLTIPDAQPADGAVYRLAVTNELGFDLSPPAVLRVVTEPRPRLGRPVVLPDGTVRLEISGADGAVYRLWSSTNLLQGPVEATWTVVKSGVFGPEPAVVEDRQPASASARFYLLSSP